MNGNQEKKSRESKNAKSLPSNKDLTDVTIVSTPLPQATSTVDRRSLLQGKGRRSMHDEPIFSYRQLKFDDSNNVTCESDQSSLGILQVDKSLCTNLLEECPPLKNNNSKQYCDRERELALKTLEKYNKPLTETFSKLDKENNVNSSNLPKSSDVIMDHKGNAVNRQNSLSQNGRVSDCDKRSTATGASSSIVFEPNEMAGRSSEYIRTSDTFHSSESKKSNDKSQRLTRQSCSGISYNSNLGELMAQFGDDEFMSQSKAESLLLNAELSMNKNAFASIPTKDNENNRLEFSCFSGIIGPDDLTLEDGMSVGEFFQRKCGALGHLSINSDFERPSIGLDPKSPQRQGRCRPLIDKTVTSEDFHPEEADTKVTEDCTKDPSVMSLSSIAKMLEDMESATPMKLVDKIMEENKKTKKHVENVGPACKTYTILPNNRSSLPCTSMTRTDRQSYGNKFSLGSRNISQGDDATFDELLTNGNISDQQLRKLFVTDDLDSELSNGRLSLQQNHHKISTASVPRADCSLMPSSIRKFSQIPCTQNDFDKTNSRTNKSSLIRDVEPADQNQSEPTLVKDDSSLKEDTLKSCAFSPLVKDQSFEMKKVKIGKKTQELCTCLVGIPREADFELLNETDRWIVCKLQLYQIQGEKDNIELELPKSDILIEPDKRMSFKIGVKMPRMGKLIIVVLHIPCSDMVTKKNWLIKHLMCFVPEEPDIKIFIPSNDDNDVMNFQMITEDTSSSIPITLENKNSIDVPVLLSITQDKPELFSINCGSLDESLNSRRKPVYAVLKPKMPLTLNIDFRGMSLQSFGEKIYQKGVHGAEAKLSVSICFKENEEYLVREIKLKGFLGSCKLDIIDTQFPLAMQPKVVKLINVKNSGSIVVTATVDVVQSKGNQIESRDFFISPNNVMLNEGEKLTLHITYRPENNKTDVERCAMIRIIVGNKVSFYPVVGEKTCEAESYSENSLNSLHQLQRSETPQCLKSFSSPTSPQSMYFNKSGTSGRQSPCSTASGSTAAVSLENIIPLRSTHTSLVWASIKVGKSDTKHFSIRNTSNSKIKLFASIKSDGYCFKFSKERHSLSTSMVLSLQGMESKTLFVVFTPTCAKAAAGKMIFSYYNQVKENKVKGLVKVIQLFGYGGCGKIEISEAVKDTSGQMWLSLGKLNSEGILRSKIKLCNNGDLNCFVKAKLVPKALCPSVLSSWHIEPSEILLEPKGIQWITLNFRPKKNDLPSMHQAGVMHVGTLKLIHGDEPTRLRIRRLYNKLKDSGQLNDKIDEQEDVLKDIIRQISKAFPGEVFIQDLRLIGDGVQNLGDLCKGIVQNEVKLTIEIQADETMSMLQDNMEDSEMFYSLCSDHDNASRFGGESFLPTEEQ